MPLGVGIVGQPRLAQFQHEVAALGDLQRVRDGRGQVGEQLLHRGLRLEILLARELAHAPLVAQDLAFGNANARLVRLVVVLARELHRVRGHHRQVQPRRQLHGGGDMRFVVVPSGALHLEVEAVRKDRRQLQRALRGAALVALQQRLPHRPGLRAGQRDQALAEFAQPFRPAHGLRLHDVARPAARQQLAQVQVALAVLHQQHDAGNRPAFLAQALQHHLGADDGLDAASARFLVELDRAEQVVQVRDGERRLPVAGGRLHGLVDAVGAVDDGKFGVKAQVNEHAFILRAGPGAGIQTSVIRLLPSSARAGSSRRCTSPFSPELSGAQRVKTMRRSKSPDGPSSSVRRALPAMTFVA